MTQGRLCERAAAEHPLHPGLPACRVVAVDQSSEWEQQQVLGECETERQLTRRDRRSAACEVEGEAEGGAVCRMHGDTHDRPDARAGGELAEQRDIGVVVREDLSVDPLRSGPDERRRGSGCG